MSEFKIKVGAARQVKNDLNKTARTMGTIHGDVARVKRSLRWKVQSRDLLDQKLNRLLQEIADNKSLLNSCSSVLEQCVNTYCDTELSLVENPPQTAIRRFTESPLSYMPGSEIVETAGDAVEQQNFFERLSENAKDNSRDYARDYLLEAGGNGIVRLSGLINYVTRIGQSPSGANGFIMLNPNVVPTTSAMAKWGGRFATGCKYGLPILGGIVDYCSLMMDGKEVDEALTKAGAHLVIGVAGGAAGAKIGAATGTLIGTAFPGLGNAAGAAIGGAVGFVSGFAITMIGNTTFDTVYDHWGEITEGVGDFFETAGEKFDEACVYIGEKTAEGGKILLDGIGNACPAGGVWLGAVVTI